ncbi:uncharacterized protein [Nicotiana tomentosiformis]|uniref:uncharacterized protein n=1 Tax=Nicotiana tomentosiformis TaxID=4098 RepID=UPI00388CBE79
MSSKGLMKLDKFTRLFPIHFSGAPSEDPHDYLDHCYDVLSNMGMFEFNGVDFVVFQMTSSTKRWWKDHMWSRPAGLLPHTWDQFSQLFMEKFIPFTLKEEYHMQFEHLQQGSINVTQYETQFMDLARHIVILLPTESKRVRRLIDVLTFSIRVQMDKETGDDISF